MLPFSANIETFGPPIDFYERIKAVKESGFEFFEFWSWENKDLNLIKEYSEKYEIGISSFSGDAAEFALCDDKHQKGYVDYALASIEVAKQIGCNTIVIHSNALGLKTAATTKIVLDIDDSLTYISKIGELKGEVVLAIGPERGWSERERELFRSSGFSFYYMGKRVLRTETACCSAIALIQAQMGLL